MATYGVTAAGFVIPQLTDIQSEINNTLTNQFGANIDLSASGPFGQLSGIFSEREYLLWAAMADVYNSQYPNTAFGASLDNVGSISGIPRLGALASTIVGVKLYGTPGTLVPALTVQFSVFNSPSSIFQTTGSATLVAGQNCIQTLSFSSVPDVGNWELSINASQTTLLAFNANAVAVQTAIRLLEFCGGCVVTGDYTVGFTVTFAGAGTGGLMVQPIFIIASNTLTRSSVPVVVTPLITQPGIDQGIVNVSAVSTGPVVANTGTLTVINTPISGLSGVLNVVDAVVGRNVESDNAYRARRATELQIAGAGTFEAIRSKLIQLSGVTAVILFENSTDIPDAQGRPPHSFEAVVQGGDDQTIADLIWQVKPAGIQTDGGQSETITDSEGQVHTVKFSRPTPLLIYMIVNLTVDVTYPSNGDAVVKQLLVDYGNALGIGESVIVIPKLISAIASVQGIDDAVILIGTAPSPTLPNNIIVSLNQVATFDTGRVSVVHV